MHNRIGFNRLGRKASHRKAMLNNMIQSLFLHERIQTTKAKAKEVGRLAEKMITRARVDSVANRRLIARKLHDKAALAKLFNDIGPRFKERNGGYTQIFKTGFRRHDAAETAIVQLVDFDLEQYEQTKHHRQHMHHRPQEHDENSSAQQGGVQSGNRDQMRQHSESKGLGNMINQIRQRQNSSNRGK